MARELPIQPGLPARRPGIAIPGDARSAESPRQPLPQLLSPRLPAAATARPPAYPPASSHFTGVDRAERYIPGT